MLDRWDLDGWVYCPSIGSGNDHEHEKCDRVDILTAAIQRQINQGATGNSLRDFYTSGQGTGS
ncbi:MAG: hypothetical protein EWV55_19945 [Microcystis viridis Mv_BB_P_19951000_S69]|uniref:Uncharacterized protein n=1 Tax=Microcystis viridis Mv_BB_P_19951000_S68D TaxID=2486270 RepID=A0A552I864_MICVR|nr:MAG: hypothetical protein EWV55_19945 [Microcystis viridis Mv_BB_P_19951000_S69]TRU76022.1 MAG: hypothetical protein EWV47_07285 [Microcystis viridis Mv_BB_P_19951000_S68]TRU79634.1 MAG: hypothetical protein EWV77_02255 [Microcystis viridis Mv_BB_P_19951000_S68D]TRU80886.1 MAG: hypothetical protein EWV46_22245 [Microcystis viridis Mv_BB_P_19951000_S69D]